MSISKQGRRNVLILSISILGAFFIAGMIAITIYGAEQFSIMGKLSLNPQPSVTLAEEVIIFIAVLIAAITLGLFLFILIIRKILINNPKSKNNSKRRKRNGK